MKWRDKVKKIAREIAMLIIVAINTATIMFAWNWMMPMFDVAKIGVVESLVVACLVMLIPKVEFTVDFKKVKADKE